MTPSNFNAWFESFQTFLIQAQSNLNMPLVAVIVGALIYWRTKNALVRILLCTLAGGWLLYVGYERMMVYATK